MLKSLPWYQRYPDDFLRATAGMSLEVKGAYSILIDVLMLRDGTVIDDPRYIAGNLGCSVRKWNSIKNELIALGKISVCGNVISNKRAEKEEIKRRKSRDQKLENLASSKQNNDLAPPIGRESTDTESDNSYTTSDSGAPPPDEPSSPCAAEALVEELMAEYPGLRSRLAIAPSLNSDAPFSNMLANGAQPDDIRAVVQARAHKDQDFSAMFGWNMLADDVFAQTKQRRKIEKLGTQADADASDDDTCPDQPAKPAPVARRRAPGGRPKHGDARRAAFAGLVNDAGSGRLASVDDGPGRTLQIEGVAG